MTRYPHPPLCAVLLVCFLCVDVLVSFWHGLVRPEKDLMMTVGSDLSTEDVRTAIKQFDTTGNGKVTFE